MDAVFRIADRITVMVNGTVIATRRPGVDPRRTPKCAPPTSARTSTEHAARRSHGLQHLLRRQPRPARRRRRDRRAATSVGLLGRNGMGKTTLIRIADGLRARRPPAACSSTASDVTGWAPEKMARRGIGYVPEGRGIFPNLSVRENLVMSARAGIDGKRDWTFERVMATFPRLAERLVARRPAAVGRRAADARRSAAR